MQTKMTRRAACELSDTVIALIESQVEFPYEFVYCMRKNRDRLKSEVAAIRETSSAKLKPYIDKLRTEKAIPSEHSARPDRILSVQKYDEITEEFADVRSADSEFLKAEIEIDLHQYQKETPEGIPSRHFNRLADANLLQPPESEKKTEPKPAEPKAE